AVDDPLRANQLPVGVAVAVKRVSIDNGGLNQRKGVDVTLARFAHAAVESLVQRQWADLVAGVDQLEVKARVAGAAVVTLELNQVGACLGQRDRRLIVVDIVRPGDNHAGGIDDAVVDVGLTARVVEIKHLPGSAGEAVK